MRCVCPALSWAQGRGTLRTVGLGFSSSAREDGRPLGHGLQPDGEQRGGHPGRRGAPSRSAFPAPQPPSPSAQDGRLCPNMGARVPLPRGHRQERPALSPHPPRWAWGRAGCWRVPPWDFLRGHSPRQQDLAVRDPGHLSRGCCHWRWFCSRPSPCTLGGQGLTPSQGLGAAPWVPRSGRGPGRGLRSGLRAARGTRARPCHLPRCGVSGQQLPARPPAWAPTAAPREPCTSAPVLAPGRARGTHVPPHDVGDIVQMLQSSWAGTLFQKAQTRQLCVGRHRDPDANAVRTRVSPRTSVLFDDAAGTWGGGACCVMGPANPRSDWW